MNKYLVIYRAPASSRANVPSPEQQKAAMDDWMGWAKRTGSALAEMGAPLGASAHVGGEAAADDMGGFSILAAESLDHAKKLLDNHPHSKTPGGFIEVFEFVKMPGM